MILSWDTDDELSDEKRPFSSAVSDERDISPFSIDAYAGADMDSGDSDSDDENIQSAASSSAQVAASASSAQVAASASSAQVAASASSAQVAASSSAQVAASSSARERLVGRDGTLWKSSSPANVGRVAAHNVFRAKPGVSRNKESSRSSYDVWKYFISEPILRLMCKYTNEEAQRRGDKEFFLTLADLEKFIALQYARGIYGKGHPVAFLWSKKYGIPIFFETMSRRHFLNILKYLRFDDKPNRVRSGPAADKFAPIRHVFQEFSTSCQKNYTCDFSLTVDEQLMPLKSRCSFITFMPNKPDKYGVKFWVLADVKTKYVSCIDVYLGAQEKEARRGVPLAESVVVKLTNHIKNKGYNITCNNFFTSLPLAEKLAKDKVSIVGTMRKNRRALREKMTKPKKKGAYSSDFYWHDPQNFLFVKYQPKEKKSVCLLSTMHSSTDVDTNTEKKKPEVILFYNANKVGVDCLVQMARLYTTATRRWPVAVWGNILDIAAINSWILFRQVTKENITRREFILILIEILINKQPEASNTSANLGEIDKGLRKRRKCHGKCCENKTMSCCISCQTPTCGKCSQDNFRVIYVRCLACTKLTI